MTLDPALAALALLFPAVAPALRLDVVRSVVTAAETHHVRPALVLAACFAESRLATVRTASLCGTRVRHTYVDGALSADIAARSLSRRIAECRRDDHALVAYRFGNGCNADDRTGYARRVARLAQRAHAVLDQRLQRVDPAHAGNSPMKAISVASLIPRCARTASRQASCRARTSAAVAPPPWHPTPSSAGWTKGMTTRGAQW